MVEQLREVQMQDLQPGQYCLQVIGDGKCRLFGQTGEIVPGQEALELFAKAYGLETVPEKVLVRTEATDDNQIFYSRAYVDEEELDGEEEVEIDGQNYCPLDWVMINAQVPLEMPDEPMMVRELTFLPDRVESDWWN